MAEWLLAPFIIYALVAGIFFLAQDRLLFPRGSVAAAPLPPGGEVLTLTAPDGVRLAGVKVPARDPSPERPVVIGFGGNAWSANAMAGYLAQLLPEAEIAVYDYRGYLESEGRPSARAISADALAIYDETVRRSGERPVVLAGFSIGSGVAASLAAARPVDGAILVTPFDSLREVAANHFPWLPVGSLFRHELAAADALEGTDVPVVLLAAERDTIIPPERTAALRARLDPLLARRIAGTGHNDIYAAPAFQTAAREGFAAISATWRDAAER